MEQAILGVGTGDLTPYFTAQGMASIIGVLVMAYFVIKWLSIMSTNNTKFSNLRLEREKAKTLYEVTINNYKTGIVEAAAKAEGVELVRVKTLTVSEAARAQVAEDMENVETD